MKIDVKSIKTFDGTILRIALIAILTLVAIAWRVNDRGEKCSSYENVHLNLFSFELKDHDGSYYLISDNLELGPSHLQVKDDKKSKHEGLLELGEIDKMEMFSIRWPVFETLYIELFYPLRYRDFIYVA